MEDACLSGRQMQQCPCSTWSPFTPRCGAGLARPSFWQLTQTCKARAFGRSTGAPGRPRRRSSSPSPFKKASVPEPTPRASAKMLPAIARQAIAAYSQPGDLVLDPMCGIGTTLVEAIHLGRDAFGVELESRWANLASANIAHACRRGATGTATVVTGDARHLAHLVDPDLAGRVALVLTSPPMVGACTARSPPAPAVVWPSSTTPPADPANLRRVDQPIFLDALEEILVGCRQLLCPGAAGVDRPPLPPSRAAGGSPGQPTQVAEAAGWSCMNATPPCWSGCARTG